MSMSDSKQLQRRFLELYEPIHAQFHRYCEVMVKNPEMAKDLQGDVILAAYESFNTLRNPASFKYFLFGIARNTFRKNLKRNKVHAKYEMNNNEPQAHDGASIETNVDVGLLYDKLDMLNPKQKEALILFEISGFSLKEIKEIQGGSLSGVKLRLKRGRQKLKELFSDSTMEVRDPT